MANHGSVGMVIIGADHISSVGSNTINSMGSSPITVVG